MKRIVNADPYGKVALQGYDPVTFHTLGKAMKGDPYISAKHGEHIYFFASEANKEVFTAHAEKYLPAYGGYCAYGVTLGVLAPVEMETWELVNGRLVLQYSLEIRKKFNENKEANLAKADEGWAKITERLAGQ
jgi:YHS domain-containing protein